MGKRVVVIIVALILVACQPGGGILPQLVRPGFLEGHVNIGPLTPVQRAGEPAPTVSPQAYAARQIIAQRG